MKPIKIEQYDWSKLQPKQQFKNHLVLCSHKQNQKLKTTKPGKVKVIKKKKPVKAIDKTVMQFRDKSILAKLRRIF